MVVAVIIIIINWPVPVMLLLEGSLRQRICSGSWSLEPINLHEEGAARASLFLFRVSQKLAALAKTGIFSCVSSSWMGGA